MKIKRAHWNELVNIAEARLRVITHNPAPGIDEAVVMNISLRELVKQEYTRNYGIPPENATHRILHGPIEMHVMVRGSCDLHGVYLCNVCPPVPTFPPHPHQDTKDLLKMSNPPRDAYVIAIDVVVRYIDEHILTNSIKAPYQITLTSFMSVQGSWRAELGSTLSSTEFYLVHHNLDTGTTTLEVCHSTFTVISDVDL